MTSAKELNVNPKLIYPVPPSWPADFAKLPLSEYVAALNFWTPDVPTEASKKFVADFNKKYGKDPVTYWQPLGYTNVISLAKAIEEAGSEDQAAVIKALENQNIDTPVGNLQFQASKKIKHQGFTDWLSVQYRNGKQEIVWPENIKTKDLVYPVPAWNER
jgi:branched-chain amino acid transport system substrate-binding protein